ncbi:MAG TPA: class I SAM-dependent methyltransferase [Candidatus Polarisedimenticolia bacterium]|nr:class I SAM-dependent methyltransferase [Candidatus Polarisedimenticolia bacterium]
MTGDGKEDAGFPGADRGLTLESDRADFDRIARLVSGQAERPDRYEPFLLEQIPASSGRILEIGCGAGRLARALAARGARVTGIDASFEMISLARRRAAEAPAIELLCADFMTHALEDEGFDAVVTVATLHHLPASGAVARMKSLVKPGGVLVIHDLRSPAGFSDWLLSGVAAAFNGDALWWTAGHLRQSRALRDAWRDHGSKERYPTMMEAHAFFAAALPGVRLYRHPLWRYTAVWIKPAEAA